MMKHQTGRAPSVAKGAGAGILTGLALAVMGAAVLATLLNREVLSMEKLGYGAMAVHLIGVFLGVRVAMGRTGHMGNAAAAITGAGYYLSLLLINALFFGGHYTGLGTTLILVLLAVGVAILTAGKGSGKRNRRRYKIPK